MYLHNNSARYKKYRHQVLFPNDGTKVKHYCALYLHNKNIRSLSDQVRGDSR